jgi:hypothetical protein
LGPSIVTSGPDKGLCRNYQVTGEMATRSVVRIEFDDELAVDANGNLIRDANGDPFGPAGRITLGPTLSSRPTTSSRWIKP